MKTVNLADILRRLHAQAEKRGDKTPDPVRAVKPVSRDDQLSLFLEHLPPQWRRVNDEAERAAADD